jgi:hypothetical protein
MRLMHPVVEEPKKSSDTGAVAPVVWIVLASVVVLTGFTAWVVVGPRETPPVPERIRIAAEGYSTNDLGERCAVVRIHNGNPLPMLGLTYMDAFPNRPGLFMPLPASGDATGMLSFPTNAVASAVKVTCFVEDRRWYVRVVMAIDQWRTGRKQPVHRVLFVVPGPVVGP